ncbi:MAG TPA: hypothetical protein VNI60_05655 [Pyrinomonadaceae bacterium]|nr:hypothetical protein [Pyrinomonadaceae bacterium]
MNNLPRQMLCQILKKYGNEVCSDAKRCEGLLNDLCGSYGREINVLVNAIEERVPLDLLAANSSMPHELLLTKLEKRLEEQTALTTDAAQWAVESWALALGVATEAEIEKRHQKRVKPTPTISNIETTQPNSAEENKVRNTNRGNFPPPAQTRKQTPPPTQTKPPSIQQFPTNQTRTNAPRPPATKFPPGNLPVNRPSAQTVPTAQNLPAQTPTSATIPKRSFGFFRGCLIVVFLLITLSTLLFFGVPYAIETMRETQRERNNESPRFPVR